MRKFTDVITNNEEKINEGLDSLSLLKKDITSFINKVKKAIPSDVQKAIYLTQKYEILDKPTLLAVKNAKSTSSLKKLADDFKISIGEVTELRDLLANLKSSINVMPQMLSKEQREEIEAGRLATDDLTIDLETERGRKAAAKMYTPIVMKIAKSYEHASKLSLPDLISAGMLGMAEAINNWSKDNSGKGNTVSLKTYIGFRAKQQILNDINKYSHDLSTNQYANSVAQDRGYNMDAHRVDLWGSDEGNEDGWQRLLASAGTSDIDSHNSEEKADKMWSKVFSEIEKRFSQRDMDIFYRYFGLNGRDKEKSKDIAKAYGMSEGNIKNSVINKIIKFLKTDRRSADTLDELRDMYTESLMIELFDMDRNVIIETLISDDVFILLEDVTRWNDRNVYINSVHNALGKLKNDKERSKILDILSSDFDYLDSLLKKEKSLIMNFLSTLYPTENMHRKTDVSLLEYMQELQEYHKKHYVNQIAKL